MSRCRLQAGVGLVEALIATAVVATAMATLAGLAALALGTVVRERDRTLCAIHAQTKLEFLMASRASVEMSPWDALARDEVGWSEFLDTEGRRAGLDAGYEGAVFVRRWQVAPVSGRPGLSAITVMVARCRSVSAAACQRVEQAVRVAGMRSESVW